MKSLAQGLLVASFFLVLHVSPAQATIDRIYGPPGELCTVSAPRTRTFEYPVRQGHTAVLDVEGQYVDLSTSLEVTGSGVTVSSAGTSSSNKKIQVTVSSDAAPGLRTIKLHYTVEFNGPDTFQVLVIRSGIVASVTVPEPTEYFNDVDVTLHGAKLDNAGVIILPTTIGTFSVGGTQVPQPPQTLTETDATATVKSSASDYTVVTVHFIGDHQFAEAKATLILFDKQLSSDTCKYHRVFCYGGVDNNKGESTFHVVGPNAVSAITFPITNAVSPGSVLTIKITLLRPAKTGGEHLRWQVVPSDSFVEATGSGTQFSPVGENSVTIPQGDQTKQLTIQFRQPPSGCALLGCRGQVRTRMVNFNVDQPPFLRIATFTMLIR